METFVMDRLKEKKIWVVVGTRPEAIKQVPVYWKLCERFGNECVALVSSGQHRELLTQALAHFGVEPDADFSLMKEGQSLSESAANTLRTMGAAIEVNAPEWVLVQGDTTTAAMAAWAAFQTKCRVLHVEAGLRSYDLNHPFPEEANRKLISVVAARHAAPTDHAKSALLKEGVPEHAIRVTGNTGIDALVWTLKHKIQASEGKCREVLITAHRRENRGNFGAYFRILKNFCEARSDLHFVMPMHPNDFARADAKKFLSSLQNVDLVPPLDYVATCEVLARSLFVITDSGGIQEEASSLGARVVICRSTTERPEAVMAGRARLAPADDEPAFKSALEWAAESERRNAGREIVCPLFGEGNAASKIADWFE